MAESKTSLGAAYFNLIPSMDGTEAAINKSLRGTKVSSAGSAAGQSIGSKMVSGIGSTLSAATVALGSIVADVAMSAVSGLGSTISGAIDLSDSLKKFGTTMEFAGFSDADIEAAKSQMKGYADQTVYDLSTVSNTVAQLGANGVDNFVGLTMAAGNLNAVAGGDAQTFESLAMVLTQTAGAGKLTTENWNQLANAIPGASGVLQQAMLDAGAYTGNFRDALEKGEITAEEFNAAILSLGWTDAAWEAATSTQTIEGAMGNFEAAVTGAMSEVYDAINGDGRITGAIVALGDNIGKLISGTAPKLGALVTRVEGIFASGNPTKIATDLATLLGGAINGAVNAIVRFIPSFTATGITLAGSVAQGITTAAPMFLLALQNLITGGLFPLATGAAEMVATFAVNLVMGLPKIVEAATTMLSGIVQAVPGVLDSLLASLNTLINFVALALPGLASSLITGAVTLFGSIATAVPQILTNVTDALVLLAGNIAAKLPALGDTLATEAPKIFECIAAAVPGVLTSIQTNLINLVTAAAGLFPALANLIGTVAPSLFSSIASAIPGLLTSMSDNLTALVTSFYELFPTAASLIATKAPEMFSGIASAVSGILPGIITALSNVLVSLILNFPTWAKSLALAAGTLFSGIVDALPEIVTDLCVALFNVIVALLGTLPTLMSAIKTASLEMFGAIVTALGEQVTPLVDGMGELIRSGINAMAPFILNMLGAANTLWGTIVTAVTGKIESLKTAAGNLIQGAIDKIGEFDLITVGQNIVQGLIDGIVSMATSLATNFTNTVTGAVDAVKDFFGIASPSKLMFEFGGFVDEGFANGIVASAGLVSDAMNDLTGIAIDPFESADFEADAVFKAASTSPVGTVTNNYSISIDGMSAQGDDNALELLREFVAGIVQTNGRKAVFA